MNLTPDEDQAIREHATALGLSIEDYLHQSAAHRALAWKRELAALHEIAARRGVPIEELLRRGTLADEDDP